MKKLFGILFCFGFLLLAGTLEIKAQTESCLEATHQMCDVGKPSLNTDKSENRFVESFENADYSFEQTCYTIRINKLKEASARAVAKTNYALRSEMRFILDCPVVYLHKRSDRFNYKQSHYSNPSLPKVIWQPYFNI